MRCTVIFHLRVSGCSSRCRVCSSCPFSTETRLYLPSWFSWRQNNSQQCKSHDFEHFTEWTDIKVTEITLHSTSLKKHYSYKWPCLKMYFLLKKRAQWNKLFTGNRIYELWIINRSSINCMSLLPWPSPVSSWRYLSPPGAARDSAVHWTNSQTASPLETAGTRLSSASAKREGKAESLIQQQKDIISIIFIHYFICYKNFYRIAILIIYIYMNVSSDAAREAEFEDFAASFQNTTTLGN